MLVGLARSVRIHRLVAIAALLMVTTVGPIEATNFGSQCCAGAQNSGVFLTPNSAWKVAQRGLTDKYETGVTWALNNQYAPTDLVVTNIVDATICIEDLGQDMCVYDSDYGDNGFNGWNSCAGTTSGSDPNKTCALDWVRINQFYDPPARRIACHEMGHGVGLQHTDTQASCMKRTADGGNSEVLTTHDTNHLNAEY